MTATYLFVNCNSILVCELCSSDRLGHRFYKLEKIKFRAQSLLYTGSKMMYLIWKNVRHINQAISKIRSFSELAVWMCSVKTVFLKFLQNFSRKHLRWCISLTKLQAKGVRTVNWIWKIFKNTFCMKQLQRLLLAFKVSKVYLLLLVNMKPYILAHTLPPSLYMHA